MKEIFNLSIIILISFTAVSCDGYKKFFEQNRNGLYQLAEASLVKLENKDTYCTNGNSLDSLAAKMRDLDIDCIRKDTIEGTLNFVFKHRKTLSSIEMVYQYNDTLDESKSFPRAGEVVGKLSNKWFVRKITFD